MKMRTVTSLGSGYAGGEFTFKPIQVRLAESWSKFEIGQCDCGNATTKDGIATFHDSWATMTAMLWDTNSLYEGTNASFTCRSKYFN